MIKEKERVKMLKERLRADGFVGYADGQSTIARGETLQGWKPKEDETVEDVEWRVARIVKMQLGELE